MNEPAFASLEACFGDRSDPRVEGRCDHKLIDIILIAVCAVWCGAESWSEVEEFGQAKATGLRQYLELPAGIPSHDTFSLPARMDDRILMTIIIDRVRCYLPMPPRLKKNAPPGDNPQRGENGLSSQYP